VPYGEPLAAFSVEGTLTQPGLARSPSLESPRRRKRQPGGEARRRPATQLCQVGV